MAVRQYVGARYVPKFYEFNDGVWQSNTEYEPLTIVQYNGNSYTSKKPVPANIGNPSENGNYWVVTGNYNAQVEGYRREVLNLSGRVDDIKCFATPEMYGAVGDGVTDDTNALKDCCDNNDVVFLTKKYKISSTINISNNIRIYGFKKGEIVSSNDITLLSILDTSGFTLDGVILRKRAGINYHIVTSGQHQIITNCSILNTDYSYINYVGGISIEISSVQPNFECYIEHNFMNISQIKIEGHSDGYIKNNVIWTSWGTSNDGITPPCYAIDVNASSYSINDNQIVGGELGAVRVRNYGGADMSQFNIINNYFDGSYTTVHTGTQLTLENSDGAINISGNRFTNSYKNSITIKNVSNTIIVNNMFFGNNRSDTSDAEIEFDTSTYGNRSIISNNQFYYKGRTSGYDILKCYSNDNIIFNYNLINTDQNDYAPYGYVWRKDGVMGVDNQFNGINYQLVSGIASHTQNGYGIAYDNHYNKIPNLSLVWIDGNQSPGFSLTGNNFGGYITSQDSSVEGKQVTALIYHRATQ